MANANIDKCGLYQDDCRNWSRKTRSDNTWGNFKAHLARGFKETRRSLQTSSTEGYVAHVHAAQSNAWLLADMQQDHTLALANLATATQANITSVALLTKTISDLSGQVALLTETLATAQSEKARMKKSGHQTTTDRHWHRASSNTTSSEPNPRQDRNLYSWSRQRFDPNGYCNPHGYKVEESHTSATCRFTSNGHKKSATQLNIMGGKTWNREWINGGPI